MYFKFIQQQQHKNSTIGIIEHHNHKQTKSLWWVIISNLGEKFLLNKKKMVDLERYKHCISACIFRYET